MNPLIIALMGMGLLGGAIGGRGRKPIDPALLGQVVAALRLAGLLA